MSGFPTRMFDMGGSKRGGGLGSLPNEKKKLEF